MEGRASVEYENHKINLEIKQKLNPTVAFCEVQGKLKTECNCKLIRGNLNKTRQALLRNFNSNLPPSILNLSQNFVGWKKRTIG